MTNDHRGKQKIQKPSKEKASTEKRNVRDSAADLFVGGWENFDYKKHFGGRRKR